VKPGFGRFFRGAVLLCGLTVAITACAGQDSSTRSDGMAAVIKPLDNPFAVRIRSGLVSTARQHRVRISVQAADGLQDTAGQASDLEALAAEEAACYVVNPLDQTNLIPALLDIKPGTPIVNVDSPVDRSAAEALGLRITTYIGSDNVAAGRLAARAMAGLVPRGGRVAVIGGIPGDPGSVARTQGFIEGARGRFKVVTAVAADFDRARAEQAASQLITAKEPLDGIFAVNDQMALGVVDAVSAVGQSGKVAVIGMDGIPEALDAVRSGNMSATVAQSPFMIGQLAVETCLAALRGRPVPAAIQTPIRLVSAGNVAAGS
jgi:ABC-type sugar transport system substrate-binding protein